MFFTIIYDYPYDYNYSYKSVLSADPKIYVIKGFQ